jgi:CheY-like chemotaxis protein
MDESRTADLLLVEDNEGDIVLFQEALAESAVRCTLHVVRSGDEALASLHRHAPCGDAPRPDMVFLDLNLPGQSGHQVLRAVKEHDELKQIPVAVLTNSSQHSDIAQSYRAHANCYIRKPPSIDELVRVVQQFEGFWLDVVTLPPRPE